MALITFILSVLALLCFFILSQVRRLKYWQNRGVYCEEPTLLFGNLTGLRSKRSFADIWIDYYNKFKGCGKPFVGFYWFHSPAVFVMDTKLMKQILIKDFNNFTDRGIYHNVADDPLSGHLFLLEGNKWRSMRQKLTPTFTSGKMKIMFPLVLNEAEELMRALTKEFQTSNIVEVREFMARYTTDVIGSCVFGIRCSSLRYPEAEFRMMGKKAMNPSRHGSLGLSFMSSFPNLARKLHIKYNADDVEEFFLRIVREAVSFREVNEVRRNDFLDMLIDIKNDKKILSEDGKTLNNLTLEEISAQAFVFFNAGFETSSTTMSLVLYELARNQHIQEKVRKEITEVLALTENQLIYESLQQLQYLGQVILETLRLYTVLPVLNRYCLEDYPISGNPNYIIKKGMQIIVPVNALHRDPEYYPEPNIFNPDNFLPEKVEARKCCEFLAFGDGPRNCVGMRFGKMQTCMGLALLLKNFSFSVCSKTEIPMEFDKKVYLVSPKNGIFLRVEKA